MPPFKKSITEQYCLNSKLETNARAQNLRLVSLYFCHTKIWAKHIKNSPSTYVWSWLTNLSLLINARMVFAQFGENRLTIPPLICKNVYTVFTS